MHAGLYHTKQATVLESERRGDRDKGSKGRNWHAYADLLP
jgi:hypothetical protein